ncbi:MAG: hypothetical protein JXA21_10445 [Anaerolineae bacterium]|nr:hypothetical protein [Anaerolineae bacterium]
MSDDALTHLRKIVTDLQAEEGITPALLDFVDLDVAYSPVLAVRGEDVAQAVEVIKTMGGKYIVRHPVFPQTVDADSLKVMRLRYLLAVKKMSAGSDTCHCGRPAVGSCIECGEPVCRLHGTVEYGDDDVKSSMTVICHECEDDDAENS